MKFGTWTKTAEQLPPSPTYIFEGDQYLATVKDKQGIQVIAVNYVKTLVKGKEVLRWEWNNKICPWDIIAYMPFPHPYIE